MDPAMFRIDWDMLGKVLFTFIVLSFFIERALALIFERRLFIKYLLESGLKEPIALLVSFAVVKVREFDALGIALRHDTMTFGGFVVTAAIISGGSIASIKLFHDIMNAKSDALRAVVPKVTIPKN